MFQGLWEVGLREPLRVRHERLSTRTDACRILYVSDIHLRRNRSERLSRQVLDAARQAMPAAVLLGGDLVDDASELEPLRQLVKELGKIAPVLSVGGNHDHWVGLDRVRHAVELGQGHWIHSTQYRFEHRSRQIAVAGPSAAEPTEGDYRILCAHNPRIWKTAHQSGFDLVLAGHLHGCQLVAFEYRGRLYPGAMFYPYCFMTHRQGATWLVVSRGVADLVPVRWRCPREVVLCHV